MMLLPIYLLCCALTLICVVWTCIRIARTSPLMAVASFLLFPVAIVHLIRHWGEDDDDIRKPFFLALVFSALGAYAAARLAVWAVKSLEADAAMMATIEQQTAGDDEDDDGDDSAAINRNIAIAAQAGRISFVGGPVKLPDAHAVLQVPAHFRYARADQVQAVAQAMGRGVLPGTQGWLLHEKVNLTDRDLWMVEVRWFPLGHVATDQPELLKADALMAAREKLVSQSSLVDVTPSEWQGFLFRPDFDRRTGMLTWSEHSTYAPHAKDLADCYADLPGRTGVLRYSVEFLRLPRAELGFRAARLMASRTTFDEDWHYGDYSRLWDKSAGRNVADLVTGAAFAN